MSIAPNHCSAASTVVALNKSESSTRMQSVTTQIAIGVGAALFWRGSWYIMDDNVFPQDPLLSGVTCLLLGSLGIFMCHGTLLKTEDGEEEEKLRKEQQHGIGMIEGAEGNIEPRTRNGSVKLERDQAFSNSEALRGSNNGHAGSQGQGDLEVGSARPGEDGAEMGLEEKFDDEQSPGTPVPPAVASSLYAAVLRCLALYVLATACVMVWRGTWILADLAYEEAVARLFSESTSNATPNATDPWHATLSGLVSHILGATGLLLTGFFASVLAPPASQCIIRDATLRMTSFKILKP